MAGHSKWANIQHRKKAQDAKRNKQFTRLLREVHSAVREGGADPEANPRLRLAVDKANYHNVPKDNIERAIKKAAGEEGADHYEEIRYEGYAPGGVAVMVDCISDNRNRTAGEVRHAFSKHGGELGKDGSVAFLFSKQGILTYPPGTDEDRIMEVAIEAGAEELVTSDDGAIEVLTDPAEFANVKAAMEAAGLAPAEAEVTMRPSTQVQLDLDTARSTLKLLDRLEDLDDTQNVYTNADFPAEVFEESA